MKVEIVESVAEMKGDLVKAAAMGVEVPELVKQAILLMPSDYEVAITLEVRS